MTNNNCAEPDIKSDTLLEKLRAENKRLVEEKKVLLRKIESLQCQLAQNVQFESEYLPYHEYEDR